MRRRPHILLLTTDQQSWDTRSSTGHPFVATPAMDEIARHGVTFPHAYSTDPVCAPQRTSWMTGRFSSETGVPFNGGRLHPDIPDLGQTLRAGGYRTLHAGKWHVPGRAVADSFELVAPGGRPVAAGGADIHDAAVARAVAELLAAPPLDRPFFLQVHFVNPHDICEYLHRYEATPLPSLVAQGLLAPDELPPLPDNFVVPPHETVVQTVCRRVEGCLIHDDIRRAVAAWDEWDWRSFVWSYHRYVEEVDEHIGLVLDALRHGPAARDTLVVLTADHGESAARHQLFQKFTLYDESLRVPFTVAHLGWPADLTGGRVDDTTVVSGVDLFRTVCDYAEVPPPEPVHGRSLRPVVEGGPTATEEWVYSESNYLGRAIVDRRWKYITEYVPDVARPAVPPRAATHARGREQLYDRWADPGETEDLSRRPQYADVLALMRRRLVEVEGPLDQRPLPAGEPADIAATWSARIADHWTALGAGEGAGL